MAVMLVVGGAGFIGSHLVEALLDQFHVVRVLDNLSTGSLRNLKMLMDPTQRGGSKPARSNQLEFVLGDARDPMVVRKAVRGVDTIFHHAARHRVGESLQNPLEMTTVNVGGTLNVLRAAQVEGVRRVVFASSWSVYGNGGPLPFTEDGALAPRSPYAASKAAAEAYCRSYWEAYGLETICLRYFSVYGPRQNPSLENNSAVARFITTLLEGAPPTIQGDGWQTRDFVFVVDAVRATIAAAAAPEIGGRCVNVASGRMCSVWEVLTALGTVLDRHITPRFAPARPGDVRQCVGDTALARAVLDYSAQVPLGEGLRRTVRYLEELIRDGAAESAEGVHAQRPDR